MAVLFNEVLYNIVGDNMKKVELGITTFAEVMKDPITQETIGYDERINQVIDEIVLAENVGLDYFGIGEHHRKDFAISAPQIVLAAAAKLTKTIKLGSAVTVLSSDDPVRVYEQYSTLNALTHGRTEIMAGRGSFIESFPLFGYDLKDYDALFEEKLELLIKIRDHEIVSHNGPLRPPFKDLGIYPRTQYPLVISLAVGGTPSSVKRAARLKLPLFLAIIGGEPMRFKPLVDLYHETWKAYGHDPEEAFVSVHSHGYIDDDYTQAVKDYYPSIEVAMTQIGKERGWGPYTKATYEHAISPEGALYVGDPEYVAKKIRATVEGLGLDRFTLHVPVGPMAHENVLKTIEYFGKYVKPHIENT